MAKILSTTTVAGRSDPLISRRREGQVVDVSPGSGRRGFFLFSSIISSSHLHNRYSSRLLSLHIFIMSEPLSLGEMEQMNDELDKMLLPCPKEELWELLGRPLLSAILTYNGGSQRSGPPPSHKGDPVVPSTMPGTFPGSNQSQQGRTANENPGHPERVGGRWRPREGSGDSQSGDGVGEAAFDISDDEGDKGDDINPPCPTPETSRPLSSYNTVACFRDYHACSRKDSTSYSPTAGTELPNETKSNH